EGSVRRAGNRVRITGQLIEADTGSNLWADRFDGALEHIFELQDEVANKVASVISPALESAEGARAVRKTSNLQAYDFYLRGKRVYSKLTSEALDEAVALAERAAALDPSVARYHALVADIYNQRNISSFGNTPASNAAAAEQAVRGAVARDANDATVLTTYG